MNSLLISDAYKQSHRIQYPDNTTLVYSNWTPRSDKHATTKKGVVVFGIQAFLKKITREFNDNFFSLPVEQVISSFAEGYFNYFGEEADTSHVADLHELGYLPIVVHALPEGSICPIGVPMMTIYNTKPEFYWVTNFLETIMSTELWQPMTSATIAKEYKDILMIWSNANCDNSDHVQFQGHDFSMRGMSGLASAMASGAGHLLSFVGSDTIPAVYYLEKFYKANPSKEMVGVSIPATEHSVMSMGEKEHEFDTFEKLITEIYPTGLISIVSDTWDLWKVLTDYLPKLKEEILERDGKVVIRPDSGDPVDIICGKRKTKGDRKNLYASEEEQKGVIELLWDIFGGTINKRGFKVLDPHIGAIYGDSITIERANSICEKLHAKGFAASNIVFGIGSYTYQYNTRDNYGFAMKATYGELKSIKMNTYGDVIPREIFKDPITDDGAGKKSLKGLLVVQKDEDGKYFVKDQQTWDATLFDSELKEIFRDEKFVIEWSLSEIRDRLWKK